MYPLSLPTKGELCIGRWSAVQAAVGCVSSRRMYESRRMCKSRNHRCYAKLSVAFHPVSPKGTSVTWLRRLPRSCGHTWFPLFLQYYFLTYSIYTTSPKKLTTLTHWTLENGDRTKNNTEGCAIYYWTCRE
jgi:hypothetical protein